MITSRGYREIQNPQELLQYNWLNVIIANLSDKYKVDHKDIEKAIRQYQEEIPQFKGTLEQLDNLAPSYRVQD
jgi:hypothetical protein